MSRYKNTMYTCILCMADFCMDAGNSGSVEMISVYTVHPIKSLHFEPWLSLVKYHICVVHLTLKHTLPYFTLTTCIRTCSSTRTSLNFCEV